MAFKEYRLTKEWPYHVSCGGVVYRSKDYELEVMVLMRHDGSFDIPKGTLHVDETLQACALREVEEESGQIAEIAGYLGSGLAEGVDKNSGAKISKATHYFALKWIADTGSHDDEYNHIEWTTPQEAQSKLKASSGEIVGRLVDFIRLFPAHH
ncbi:MAG TPA: NUDIX domain-containing protein [Magnetospirillaceae bacterium]|nr:NUDIX domain-containing protein [Magnetospirillaceae bacterium]